jgi:hypothetical protein
VDGVTITRVGTQVVVRLSGPVDGRDGCLDSALDEVAALVLGRVVVDLTEAGPISDAGLDFLVTVQERWTVRLLDPPAGLRQRLARHRDPAV